ncbi:hypothetical protein EVAR_43189_1, partial [Eumeta japonica]
HSEVKVVCAISVKAQHELRAGGARAGRAACILTAVMRSQNRVDLFTEAQNLNNIKLTRAGLTSEALGESSAAARAVGSRLPAYSLARHP